jgi:hypothetical protein
MLAPPGVKAAVYTRKDGTFMPTLSGGPFESHRL